MDRIDEGAWVVYPREGARPGEGGDACAVRYFGNTEPAKLQALEYVNDNPEFRAIYMAPGESISEAEEQRDH